MAKPFDALVKRRVKAAASVAEIVSRSSRAMIERQDFGSAPSTTTFQGHRLALTKMPWEVSVPGRRTDTPMTPSQIAGTVS